MGAYTQHINMIDRKLIDKNMIDREKREEELEQEERLEFEMGVPHSPRSCGSRIKPLSFCNSPCSRVWISLRQAAEPPFIVGIQY